MDTKKLTGYPSIDKPWLKFYSLETVVPSPDSDLYSAVYENNKEHLDDYALRYFDNRITYKALFDGINTAVNAFLSIGVGKGDIVSFISVYTPEMIFSFYALNRIGAVCNMLDPRTTADGMVRQIENTACKVLVIQDACTDNLDAIVSGCNLEKIILLPAGKSMGVPIKQIYGITSMLHRKHFSQETAQILVPWKSFVNSKSAHHALARNSEIAPAAIYYTGGTTGEPKGVLLSNGNINSVWNQFAKLTEDFARQQTWLTPSVPFIAYSFVCSLHMPLVFGMECCIELYDNTAIAKKVLKKKYQHVAATPVLYDELIRISRKRNISLNFLIMPTTGADKMSEVQYQTYNQELAKWNNPWKICNGYGMTEVSSAACVCYKGKSNKPGSVGIPFPDTLITAFEPGTDKEVCQGEQGEICISGPGVMMGYYKNQEMTNSVIRIHSDGRRWMHTGDIGHIDEDGCVFIDGRIKRMIVKHDAFKVFPSDIEEKVLKCNIISNCCCVGIKDEKHIHGDVPVLFVVLNKKEDQQIAKEEVIQFCQANLAAYAVPQEVYILDSLPITHAGKVDYRKLEDMADNGRMSTH